MYPEPRRGAPRLNRDASTKEGACKIREAIEFHLEGMREDGVPIPTPQSKVDYVDVSA